MNEADLLPLVNSPAELIQNLGRAEREERNDLRDFVANLTEHEDPLVREQALSLLLFKWKDAASRWRAVRALENDLDFGVRGQAAFALIGVSSETTRREDTRLLLQRFLDEEEALDTRRSVSMRCCYCISGVTFQPPSVASTWRAMWIGPGSLSCGSWLD